VLGTVSFGLRFVAWGIRWTLATIFFMGVMAAAGYYVFTETLAGGQHVTVPNIEGMPITKVAYLLADQGLELGQQTQVPHPSIPKYCVITQRPAAGRVVRMGRKVYPTVSMGADFLQTPDLLNKTLEDARKELAQSSFRMGTVARIPSNTPRDLVLAQDPPPGADLADQGNIHLLVSGGSAQPSAFMPDLRGLSVQQVLAMLAPYNVTLVPSEVDLPDAPVDVVLNQNPPPNTVIAEGQVVTYQVKPSGAVEIPDARYKTTVIHPMDMDFDQGDVRVDLLDLRGNRQTVWPPPTLETTELPQHYAAGSQIKIPVTYVQEATVEVYFKDTLVESYYLAGGAEPIKRRITL